MGRVRTRPPVRLSSRPSRHAHRHGSVLGITMHRHCGRSVRFRLMRIIVQPKFAKHNARKTCACYCEYSIRVHRGVRPRNLLPSPSCSLGPYVHTCTHACAHIRGLCISTVDVFVQRRVRRRLQRRPRRRPRRRLQRQPSAVPPACEDIVGTCKPRVPHSGRVAFTYLLFSTAHPSMHCFLRGCLCVCVYVCVCARARARMCVCVCVRERVRALARVCLRMSLFLRLSVCCVRACVSVGKRSYTDVTYLL